VAARPVKAQARIAVKAAAPKPAPKAAGTARAKVVETTEGWEEF
jgi:hypothetical protein